MTVGETRFSCGLTVPVPRYWWIAIWKPVLMPCSHSTSLRHLYLPALRMAFFMHSLQAGYATPEIWAENLCSVRLGKWHALLPLPDKNRDKECAIWTVLQQWVDALPIGTLDELATKDKLAKELHRSLADLGQTQYQTSKNVSPWSNSSSLKLAEAAIFDANQSSTG